MAVKKKPGADTQVVYTLTTGLQFTVIPVPMLLVYSAGNALTEPKPPVKIIKHGGQEHLTMDTDDPTFVEAYDAYHRNRNLAQLDVMIRRGVRLLPGQMPKDNDWLEDLEMDLGAVLDKYRGPDGEIKQRHLEFIYLRYLGVGGEKDFSIISDAIRMTEADVEEALDTFPGTEA